MRKKGLTGIFIGFFLFAAVWLFIRPASYEASATIKVLERTSIAGLLTEWIVYDPADAIASQVAMITGFPVLREVAVRQGILAEDASDDVSDGVVRRLQEKIRAENIGGTNIIKITSTADSPRAAIVLANKVIEVYVEQNLAEKRKQYLSARAVIEQQLSEVEQKLTTGERRALDNKPSGPFQKKLVELEIQLSGLMAKYTARHPQIRQIQDEIGILKNQLRGLAREEATFAQVTREVEVNQQLYSFLKKKLEETRIAEAQKVPDVSIVDPANVTRPTVPIRARVKQIRAL